MCVQGPHPPNSLLDEYMDAVTFQGKCAVSFQRVPVPQLQLPGDVVVRIDMCGLCGSDLHPYSYAPTRVMPCCASDTSSQRLVPPP